MTNDDETRSQNDGEAGGGPARRAVAPWSDECVPSLEVHADRCDLPAWHDLRGA